VGTARLDCSACCTPWSSTSILLYISSCLASCFSAISSEASFRAAMMKLKSSEVRMVCILVIGDFDLFREEGFGGKPSFSSRGPPRLWVVLLHLSFVQLLCHLSLHHHLLALVTWKQSSPRHCLNLVLRQSSLFC
jgi:hypothetical protein